MLDRSKITHRHWSVKVARRDLETGVMPDVYGAIVVALDDLHQSITNLILTPKKSVPTEPEKGCDLLGAIDTHPSVGIPYLTREIWDAIRIWEPRVLVEKVEVPMIAFSHFRCRAFWRPVASVIADLQVTEVAYNA